MSGGRFIGAVGQRPGLDRQQPYPDAVACALRDYAPQSGGTSLGHGVLWIVRRLRKFAEAHRDPEAVHALARNLREELLGVVVDWLKELVAVVWRALYRRRRASRYAVLGPVFARISESGQNSGHGNNKKNLIHDGNYTKNGADVPNPDWCD